MPVEDPQDVFVEILEKPAASVPFCANQMHVGICFMFLSIPLYVSIFFFPRIHA